MKPEQPTTPAPARDKRRPPAFESNYGSSASYTPATDYMPPVVPSADVYSPPPTPADPWPKK